MAVLPLDVPRVGHGADETDRARSRSPRRGTRCSPVAAAPTTIMPTMRIPIRSMATTRSGQRRARARAARRRAGPPPPAYERDARSVQHLASPSLSPAAAARAARSPSLISRRVASGRVDVHRVDVHHLAILGHVEGDAARREVDQDRQQQDLGIARRVQRNLQNARASCDTAAWRRPGPPAGSRRRAPTGRTRPGRRRDAACRRSVDGASTPPFTRNRSTR